MMDGLLHDLRIALRQLRRAPGFAVTVVLTLGLGIGASSAIFCLMDGLWLHPMHVPQPGKIVRLFSTTAQDQEGLFSYSEYRALAQRVTAFQRESKNAFAAPGLVAIGGRGSLMARPDGTSQVLLTDVVSSNFFTVLGVHALLGRLFTAADAVRLRTHPAVVLGYTCWQRDFGGDRNIVGRSIPLRHGKSGINQVEVWGVLPASFREIDPASDRDLWMPTEDWAASGRADELTSHQFRWFNVLGRLAPGATVKQANEQAETVAGTLAAADPANNRNRSARAVSDFQYRMSQAGTSGLVLFCIVAAVVLLAIVNVAQILLARALARTPEVALRLSLGARRWQVARQLLLENVLLALLSLGAGIALAAEVAALLPRLLIEEPVMLESYGYGVRFPFDARVFFLASCLALLTMALLALIPLRQVARPELLPVLQAGTATRTAGKMPVARRFAIWLQIGISFALLVSTGALVRSFLNTRTRNIGLTRKQTLVVWTQEPETPVRNEIVARFQALPGVSEVGYGIRSPLMPSEGGIAVKVLLPSHPELRNPVGIKFNAVSSTFLNVTGTPVLRGRSFTAADDSDGPPVVVINQAMAQKYWPGRNPIGQTVRVLAAKAGSFVDARVIGVTEDAPINQIGELPEPFLYLPWQQYQNHLGNMGEITFVLRTRQNAMSLAKDAREALIGINPLLDPMLVTSLPELIRYSAGNYQMMAELVTALGLIGLALTVVGLYGFLAYRVAQRRREIGIRMALGATREATALLVLRDTAFMAAIGLGIGVVLAIGAARLESAALFGVAPLDAVSIAAALGILSVAVGVAAWLPARRAAAVEPMQALRTE